MIYLDNGATSFPKPKQVVEAVTWSMECCGNPGRGGYRAARLGEKTVYSCREEAGKLFGCQPEQVVLTRPPRGRTSSSSGTSVVSLSIFNCLDAAHPGYGGSSAVHKVD